MTVTLITGASGGIGASIARELSALGQNLYLHYNHNRNKTLQLADELKERFPDQTFTAIHADLSEGNGPGGLISQVDHPPDHLVFAHGSAVWKMIQDVRGEEIDSLMNQQLKAPYTLTQHFLPQMLKRRRGHIVLISSIWGLTGAAMETLYSMVKGGQNSFVKALAKEVAPSGLTANAIAPGAVSTGMMAGFSEEDLRGLAEEIPAGRLCQPEEIGSLCAFLLSGKADYINGQVLSINGAWYT